MKKYSTIALWLVSLFVQAQETEQEIKSKIKQVTVFLQGAQVVRQSQISLKPGVSLLRFADVAPSVIEQSIQVSGTNGVKILSVSFRVNYLNERKKPEKISLLENEKRRLMALVREEQSKEEVYKEEETILKTNKSIGGTKGVEIDQLKIAMDYFRYRLIDIKQQLLTIDKNIRKYNEELTKIESQLNEVSLSKEQPTGEIIIKVSTKSLVQSMLTVKYLLNEARWFPSYDIRAKDIQSPVSIAYKANVSQNSGEDWENVELTISSANPSQGGSRPLIKTWYLGFNNSVATSQLALAGATPGVAIVSSPGTVRGRVTGVEDGLGLPGVNVVVKGSTVGTVTDANGNYSLALPATAKTLVFSFVGMRSDEEPINGRGVVDAMLMEDVTQLSEVVVTGYSAQTRSSLMGSVSTIDNSDGYSYTPRVKKTIVATPVVRQTNFEFTIDEPFSIKSDGEVRATEMVEYELEALYEYYCAPKLDEDAFLMAKVLHWDEYNFLEGEANLFFEGKYIGKSIMDTRNTSDTLTLSLGRDANVLVKREKVKQLSTRYFAGSNQKATYTYNISIRNKKSQPVFIVVEDQIPIPNTKERAVDKLEDSKADYDEETGMLKWRKNIVAGTSEEIKLKYSVKFPKDMKIILE